MLEYHFQHDCFMNDKTYFQIILYDKIVNKKFVILANIHKSIANIINYDYHLKFGKWFGGGRGMGELKPGVDDLGNIRGSGALSSRGRIPEKWLLASRILLGGHWRTPPPHYFFSK